MENNQGSFGKAFSDTFQKETDSIKTSTGRQLARLLTSWRAWVWLIAVVVAIIMFCTGSIGMGIGILSLALVVTCFMWILELFF